MDDSKKKYSMKESLKLQFKEDKAKFILAMVLRLLVLLTLINQIIDKSYENIFSCVLTFILLWIPSIAEKSLKIDLPSLLECIILLFVFAAQILGELNHFYVIFPYWDTVLHTLNGFIMAGVGFVLVDIFNRTKKLKVNLSPLYMAIVAFCFSMTIGVLWEFLEYSADKIVMSDMQKDTFITDFSSVALNPEGKNVPIQVNDIEEVIIVLGNGETLHMDAYLDVGLNDTMIDLFVNFIGAVSFSVLGFIYIKNRGKKGRIIKHFLPKVEGIPDEAAEMYFDDSDNKEELFAKKIE